MTNDNTTKTFIRLNATNMQPHEVFRAEVNHAEPPLPTSHSHWKVEPPFDHSEWIVCEVIQIICFLAALYILYALLHFYTVQQSRHNYSGHSSGSRWLEKMCIMSVACAIVRYTCNQILLLTGWYSRQRCSILLNVSIALYCVSLYPVYFFLWIRQRIFYSNRALKHLYNRVIRFVSWATIFCFLVLTAVSMVLFVVDRKNSASGRVCSDHTDPAHMVAHDTKNGSNQYGNSSEGWEKQGLRVNTVAGVVASLIQASFLMLFLYPIMDNKLRAVRNAKMKCHNSLMKLIRRAFVLSCICILTDVCIAFGVKGLYALFPQAVFSLIVTYDVNLILNIVCIVATFRRWRHMLFPWAYGCFGKSLVRQNTKTYHLQRRSTIGLNGSNADSFRVSPKESNRSDIWEVKIKKSPVVNALLESDDEQKKFDSNEKREVKNATGEKLNGSPYLTSSCSNSKMLYFPGMDTAVWDSNMLNGVGPAVPAIREKLDRNRNEDANKSSNFSRFNFSQNSIRNFANEYQRRTRSMRKSKTAPVFTNSRFSLRLKKTNGVANTENGLHLETLATSKQEMTAT